MSNKRWSTEKEQKETQKTKQLKPKKLDAVINFFALLAEAAALVAKGLFGLVRIAVRLMKETLLSKQVNVRLAKKL